MAMLVKDLIAELQKLEPMTTAVAYDKWGNLCDLAPIETGFAIRHKNSGWTDHLVPAPKDYGNEPVVILAADVRIFPE